jgi:hypothetical protein
VAIYPDLEISTIQLARDFEEVGIQEKTKVGEYLVADAIEAVGPRFAESDRNGLLSTSDLAAEPLFNVPVF